MTCLPDQTQTRRRCVWAEGIVDCVVLRLAGCKFKANVGLALVESLTSGLHQWMGTTAFTSEQLRPRWQLVSEVHVHYFLVLKKPTPQMAEERRESPWHLPGRRQTLQADRFNQS